MERLTRATGTEADAMLALLGGCNSETDGVELAYQALDLVVARYDLSEANLVLRPGSMAPQIFVHERGFVTPDLADSLARRPSGLYAVPDDVPLTVQDALTGCCEMALAAHVARRQAGQVVSGLSARPVMEDAVRRSASRSARFRWRFTLVLLGTVGIGPDPATPRRSWPTPGLRTWTPTWRGSARRSPAAPPATCSSWRARPRRPPTRSTRTSSGACASSGWRTRRRRARAPVPGGPSASRRRPSSSSSCAASPTWCRWARPGSQAPRPACGA
jgi:hypothetical protein